MARPSIKGSAARALASLEAAAAIGARCPSNADLAEIIGAASVSNGASIVSLLEQRGLITVKRFAMGRVVTIVATGHSTAPITGQRHWSERGVVRAQPPLRATSDKPPEPIRVFRGDVAASRIVDRDPCPCCGTRRDVGCSHSARSISMGAFA